MCGVFLALSVSLSYAEFYADEKEAEHLQQNISNEIDLEPLNDSFSEQTDEGSLTQKLMPKYGNWCGANHPKDMNTADDPIDQLDTACKTHDYCYETKGYLNCSCDNDINQELITGLNEGKYKKTEALYARAVHHYFNGSPCDGDHSSKIGLSRAAQGIVKNVGGKVVNAIKKLPIIGSTLESKTAE